MLLKKIITVFLTLLVIISCIGFSFVNRDEFLLLFTFSGFLVLSIGLPYLSDYIAPIEIKEIVSRTIPITIISFISLYGFFAGAYEYTAMAALFWVGFTNYNMCHSQKVIAGMVVFAMLNWWLDYYTFLPT